MDVNSIIERAKEREVKPARRLNILVEIELADEFKAKCKREGVLMNRVLVTMIQDFTYEGEITATQGNES